MIVNWVKEDEELLEPYEWSNGDDIEIISTLSCFKVDQKTLHDFIYGCLQIFDQKMCQKVFAIGDGHYALAIETDDQGKLCYRSVFDFCDRDKMNKKIAALELSTIHYQMYDEGEMKEYGLTREERLKEFRDETKLLEYERLDQRTRHDVEMLREVGMCPGIENYSRHIDGRKAGQRPYTLIDYFPKDFLLVVDESHVMLPQIRGMYNGDRSRKETLVEYGFRLPSALDNRPLVFEEFEDLIHQAIFVSATPGDYELDKVHHQVVEQIIRPTGLLDPIIEVRPIDGQVDDIIDEIHQRIEKNERVLITTLTKRMAEDLSAYLVELGLKVAYLHSDTKTLERTEILRDLRLGKYDVLVGINLLREGLDLPEVSLVCILDADKEGFLRSERSLIQTIGRAARNSHGKVIMYGDKITDSMQKAIDETARRREIQEKYNKEHGIIPQTIKKEIREAIHGQENVDEAISLVKKGKKAKKKDKETLIKELEKQMKEAAKALDFERAMELRDMMLELQGEV